MIMLACRTSLILHEGLLLKETVSGQAKQSKLGIKQVDKGHISTVERFKQYG